MLLVIEDSSALRSVFFRAPTSGAEPALRRRATALALAIGANLLILIALLTLNAPPAPRPQFGGRPILLDLRPEAAAPPEVQTTEAKVTPRPQPRREPTAPPPAVEPPPLPSEKPLPFIVVTREEFAASDLARFGNRGAAAGAAESQAAPDSERVGTAPNGEPLYAAEWHRRPTRAELSAYLPERMPREGWGLVACRTAERYLVEDCVELDSSPPGSRLAGAVRQAAWQFRVRPPRVGGKALIGTWVRIRIEYSESADR